MLAVVPFRVIPALLITALLSLSAAQAASITNRDDKDRKVTIIEGGAQKDQVLKPNAVLEGVCETRCLIQIDDQKADLYRLNGSDVTSIEDGQLYDDASDTPVPSNDGPSGQPSQSGPRQ